MTTIGVAVARISFEFGDLDLVTTFRHGETAQAEIVFECEFGVLEATRLEACPGYVGVALERESSAVLPEAAAPASPSALAQTGP